MFDEKNVTHNVYVTAGVIDGEVCKAQARARRDKRGEASIVHDHSYSVHDQKLDCNARCILYIPDYEIIPLLDFRKGARPVKKENE